MAPKKHEQSEFTVTDSRLFTSEGELRGDAPEETEVKKAPAAVPEPAPTPAPVQATVIEGSPIEDPTIDDTTLGDREMPIPPSSAEQEAQAAAYRQSSKDLDSQVEDRKSVV